MTHPCKLWLLKECSKESALQSYYTVGLKQGSFYKRSKIDAAEKLRYRVFYSMLLHPQNQASMLPAMYRNACHADYAIVYLNVPIILICLYAGFFRHLLMFFCISGLSGKRNLDLEMTS